MPRRSGTVVVVRGVNRVKGRQPGVVYYYHRASGKRIDGEFGSAAFFESLARLDKTHEAHKPTKGTLGAAIDAWRASPNWSALASSTRKGYDAALDILENWRDMPASDLARGMILKTRDKVWFPKHGRWIANYVVTVLSLVLQHAADVELFGKTFENPLAAKVKRIRAAKRQIQANRPWTPEECRAVLDAAPPHLAIPIALAMFAGLRKGDILRLTMGDVKDGRISIVTRKRAQPICVPIHPELEKVLARRPKAIGDAIMTHEAANVCMTSFGDPWTAMGFNASFGKFRRRLEAKGKVGKGLTLHGLRHTMGTRLREAGASDRDIADVLGQASTAMARHYSKNANLPAQTRGIVVSLDQAGRNK